MNCSGLEKLVCGVSAPIGPVTRKRTRSNGAIQLQVCGRELYAYVIAGDSFHGNCLHYLFESVRDH